MTLEAQNIIVLISADEEWITASDYLRPTEVYSSPFGEWFPYELDVQSTQITVTFFQTGCGKMPAAAATQFVIDKFNPKMIINIGTCGGFKGKIEKKSILMAKETVVYDICERSGQHDEMIDKFRCIVDLSWIEKPYPLNATPAVIATADQDLNLEMVPYLHKKYGAVAADWESGAVAYVGHKKNKRKCLILRGVTDFGTEIYEDPKEFKRQVREILPELLDALPEWISKSKLCEQSH